MCQRTTRYPTVETSEQFIVYLFVCVLIFYLFVFSVTVPMHTGRNLTITKISRTDMGAYLCMAMNGVPPSISKRIIVDVECEYLIQIISFLVHT